MATAGHTVSSFCYLVPSKFDPLLPSDLVMRLEMSDRQGAYPWQKLTRRYLQSLLLAQRIQLTFGMHRRAYYRLADAAQPYMATICVSADNRLRHRSHSGS